MADPHEEYARTTSANFLSIIAPVKVADRTEQPTEIWNRRNSRMSGTPRRAPRSYRRVRPALPQWSSGDQHRVWFRPLRP